MATYKIRPQDLSPEELQIETEIRNIIVPAEFQVSSLMEVMEREETTPILKPTNPHSRALIHPHNEVTICAFRLQSLQIKLLNCMQNPTFNSEEYAVLISKLCHLRARAERISVLEAVRISANKIVQVCETLLSVGHQFSSNEQTLQNAVLDMSATQIDPGELLELILAAPQPAPADHFDGTRIDVENLTILGDDNIPLVTNHHPQTQNVETIVQNANLESESIPPAHTMPPSVPLLTTQHPLHHSSPSKSNVPLQNFSLPHSSFPYNYPYFPLPPLSFAPPPSSNWNQPYGYPYPIPPTTSIPQYPGQRPTASTFIMEKPSNIHTQQMPSVQPKPKNFSSSANTNNSISHDLSSMHHRKSTEFTSCATPVHKWGLMFDGSASGLAVEKFLYRVEHLAKTNNISWSQLINDVPSLLKGMAAEHYWLILERDENCDWEQFKMAFTHRFQDRRTDVDIIRLIDARKQRVKEPFTEFYYDILNLALPLKIQLSESQLLEILKKNMRMGLQVHLAGRTISSISDLVSICIATEDVWRNVGLIPEQQMQRNIQYPRVHEIETFGEDPTSFTAQNLTQSPFMEPSIRYASPPTLPRSVERTGMENAHNLEAFSQNPPNQPSQSQIPSKQPPVPFCWNCRRIGHFYTDCDVIREHIFCYGCGVPDILKPHCNFCNQKSLPLNRMRDTTAGGSSRPPVRILQRPPPQYKTEPSFSPTNHKQA